VRIDYRASVVYSQAGGSHQQVVLALLSKSKKSKEQAYRDDTRHNDSGPFPSV
jgi:hypothetical protein